MLTCKDTHNPAQFSPSVSIEEATDKHRGSNKEEKEIGSSGIVDSEEERGCLFRLPALSLRPRSPAAVLPNAFTVRVSPTMNTTLRVASDSAPLGSIYIWRVLGVLT